MYKLEELRRHPAVVGAAGTVLALALALAPTPALADPLLAAAGDIACPPGAQPTTSPPACAQGQTGALLGTVAPDAVAELGDLQYEAGKPEEFPAYDQSWGHFNPISHPVPGNHEYATPGASGYYAYFNGTGSAGGPAGDPQNGYYSYDLGSWHLIALNSNCSDTQCADSPAGAITGAELQWLRDDLSAHQGSCTLAYWHHPLYSGTVSGVRGSPGSRPLWDALYAHGADVVLNGHVHAYERYAPQDPGGTADPGRGIREFVSGAGGKNLPGFQPPPGPPTEKSDDSHFGVLFLGLHQGSYDWAFRSAPDGIARDSGSGLCHEPRAAITASPVPALAGRPVTFDAHASNPDGSTSGLSYTWSFGDGGSSTAPSPSHAYSGTGRYDVSVTVTTASGVSTAAQISLTVTRAQVAADTPSGGRNSASPGHPRLRLRVLGRHLRRALRRGLRLIVSSSVAGRVDLELTLQPRRRRRRLGATPVLLTTASTLLARSDPTSSITLPIKPRGAAPLAVRQLGARLKNRRKVRLALVGRLYGVDGSNARARRSVMLHR